MASPSVSAAAVANPVSPLALDPSPTPIASRPATAALRKRPVLLLDQRPHPATPTSRAATPAVPLSQARRKRGLSSSGRPRWKTALSVAAKNAALLAVLIYLGDQAWRWAHPVPLAPLDQAALEGYNARVDDVEASLVRAFRMLQAQLEVVDRKIGGEVGAARGELAALLEEKRLALEGQLNLLDARTDELNDALGGIKRMEFLANTCSSVVYCPASPCRSASPTNRRRGRRIVALLPRPHPAALSPASLVLLLFTNCSNDLLFTNLKLHLVECNRTPELSLFSEFPVNSCCKMM